MNMKNAENNLYNIYEVCRTAEILHISEVLNSIYKNEYSRCMIDFIYVTLFSSSNVYIVNTLNDAMDISTDICTAILYSKSSESFDRSFIMPKTELFKFLSTVIHNRLLDLLRKDYKKKAKEQLSYDDDFVIEDPYCMTIEIENSDKENAIVSHILKVTNLFSAFCFLLIRYYCSYKPKELSDMLREVKTDEDFASFASDILKRHGYHLILNSVHKIGYTNKSTSPKAISDSARCVANTLRNHVNEFI